MLHLRSILIFLACLLTFANAVPLHRRTCKHASIPSQYLNAPVSASPTPTREPQNVEPQEPEESSKPTPSAKPSPSTTKKLSDAPAPTKVPEDPQDGPQTGIMAKLLPAEKTLESWSTCSEADNPLELSDKTLRPNHIMTSLSRDYVNFSGKRAIHAHYEKGSYAFGRGTEGGLSFYAPGPSSLDLTKAKEAWYGYSVYFPKNFDWVLGGKLFGLYGGNSDEESISCSGGRRSSACFSARLMWRSDAQGEFYTYLPPYTESRFSANKVQCTYKNSDCNPTYGASIGRGSFHFNAGAWTQVSQRVRLNDAGKANGELELFADGESVINIGGLILRDSDKGRIRGIQAQTFFGGSHPEFMSTKAEDVYFSDFTVAISEYL
jgi:hypothetical protein